MAINIKIDIFPQLQQNTSRDVFPLPLDTFKVKQ